MANLARILKHRLVLIVASLLVMSASIIIRGNRSEAVQQDRVSVMQYNICGYACNEEQVADRVAERILQHRPDYITLNEACREQVQAMNLMLRDRGVTYHWRFDQTRQIGTCEFGNAVLWSGFRSGDNVIALGFEVGGEPSGADHRRILCARIDAGVPPKLQLCTTHLSAGTSREVYVLRSAQIHNVASLVRAFSLEGYQVIVGGDFNQDPPDPQMNPMYPPQYRPPGTGITTEVEARRGLCVEGGGCPTEDQFKATVPGRKLDYVFLTSGFIPQRPPTVGEGYPPSDHDYLLGFALNTAVQC